MKEKLVDTHIREELIDTHSKEELVDTHIHVWNFDQADYPWLKGDTSILNRSYDLSGLEPQRSRAGVTSGVLVQAANNPGDTAWMVRTA
ncbi:MAG TPA: hypothetical protein VKQ52_02215, partial [Puia sp.]|nr:hypothetical protein [Puia sp.]